MKLYGRKFAHRAAEKRQKQYRESRDGIIWDVDSSNYVCRCKIQGSNTYVIAHYPRSWVQVPSWMKPGNSVRLVHKGGHKGYIEVAGEGRAIPTPVSGDALPTQPTLSDKILTGLVMEETSTPSMGVTITTGTVRISGVTYSVTPSGELTYYVMDDPAPMVMGEEKVMGVGEGSLALDAAPVSGEYRSDLVEVGTDGVIDYTAGGEVTDDPQQPSVASNHVQIGDYILVVGGKGYVENEDIGKKFVTPYAAILNVTFPSLSHTGDGTYYMSWDGGDNFPETTIRVTIVDNYGYDMTAPAEGFDVDLYLSGGTGAVWSATTGYHTSMVSQNFGATNTYDFKYQRNQTASPEIHPVFRVVLNTSTGVTVSMENLNFFMLYDAAGDPV